MTKSLKRNPTVADIAKLAGVAPITVSRVINSNGYVSDAVRARVEKAVAELDYSPNAIARSLKRKSTKIVGVVLPDIVNPFAAELTHGIQRVLEMNGFSCFLSTVDATGSNEASIFQALYDRRVDGIIMGARLRDTHAERLVRLADKGFPIVIIGNSFDHPKIDRVMADDRAGGYAAAKHLIDLGHERIAFIGASLESPRLIRRCEGYIQALRESCISPMPELIISPVAGPESPFTTQADGYQGMKRLLSLAERPTAVFARNDHTAMGAMFAAREAGLRIPDDMSVVGFDNVLLASYTAPPLTTVHQPISEQGTAAAELLLQRVGNADTPRREVLFECVLKVRLTTTAPSGVAQKTDAFRNSGR